MSNQKITVVLDMNKINENFIRFAKDNWLFFNNECKVTLKN